jgi:membrane protein DedA with SNARE-associated domain/CubicO group peptidase (beta-lactamase class C family)
MLWRRFGIRPVEVVCLGGLALSGIISFLVAVIAPYFLSTHTVAVEAFGGTTLSMITAGGLVHAHRLAAWVAVTIPVASIVRLSPFYWWAGRRYGHLLIDAIATRSPHARRRVARAEAIFRVLGPYSVIFAYFLPVPNGLIFAIAGWTGMGFWRFLLFDALDALLYAGVMVTLGYALGPSALAGARLITTYAGAISIAIVLVVAAMLLLRRVAWRRRDRVDDRPSVASIERSAWSSLLVGVSPQEMALDPLDLEVLVRSVVAKGDHDADSFGYALVTGDHRVSGAYSPNLDAPSSQIHFELGSLSTLFTATLLAREVVEGNACLDDHWEQGELPHDGGGYVLPSMSLGALATHTSGLPSVSWRQTLSAFADPTEPFKHFGEAHLRAFAARRQRSTQTYRYSHFNYALVALALVGGADDAYVACLRERVLGPYGLTGIKAIPELTPADIRVCGRRLGKSVGPWQPRMLTPSLGLCGTMASLADFLALQLSPEDHPLHLPVREMHRTRAIAGDSTFGIGLGWHVYSTDHGSYLTHPIFGPANTGMIVIEPANAFALAVLANGVDTATVNQVDQIARSIVASVSGAQRR